MQKGLEKKEDILKISNVSLRFKRIKHSLERTLLTMYSKHLDLKSTQHWEKKVGRVKKGF